MEIPLDIHGQVVALTDAILHDGQCGDSAGARAGYRALAHYCESTATAGRDHPFLWETLADFTADDSLAIGHYLRALALAGAAGAADYAASICLALAERHANLDETGAARDYAQQAWRHARDSHDLPLRQAIRQFLQEHATGAGPR